jgi:hypothetical protein
MWTAITQIFIALGSIAGLLTVLYKYYWSPRAKKRREEEEKWQKSNKTADPGGMYCLLLLLFIIGCSSPRPVTILESEHFPVKVEVNGVPFDRLSILDIMDMNDWSQVKITPVRKNDKNTEMTHWMITPRAIDKLRPKAE